MVPMIVTVTAEHIAKGIARKSGRFAVALALQDATGEPWDVDMDHATCKHDACTTTLRLSTAEQAFIRYIEAGHSMAPFRFGCHDCCVICQPPKPIERRREVVALVPPYISDDLYRSVGGKFGADVVFEAAKTHPSWAGVVVKNPDGENCGVLTMAVVSFNRSRCKMVADWYLMPVVGTPSKIFYDGDEYHVVTTYKWWQDIRANGIIRLELDCELT